jgi:hypothetical protein
MEVDLDLVRIEGRKFLAEFEFAVSARVPAYCIREIVTNRNPCVTKSTRRWSTALSRSRSMARTQICIWKLIGTEHEGQRSGISSFVGGPEQVSIGPDAMWVPIVAMHLACRTERTPE